MKRFSKVSEGGDPSAGSPTDTLLQLSPPRKTQNQYNLFKLHFIKALLSWLDGRCVQGAGTNSPRDITSTKFNFFLKLNQLSLISLNFVKFMTRDYWGFHFHEDELQSSIRTEAKFRRLPCSFEVGAHCLNQCRPRVAQEIRAILIYRCPFLPQSYLCSPLRVHTRNLMLATKSMGLARCLS